MALTDLNRMMKSEAIQGIAQTESAEQQRKQTNEQIKTAEKQGTLGAIGTGAATGAMIGGPWGALIGAGVGLIGDALL